MASHSNAQREIQLLGEWLATLPSYWKTKTHVNVGVSTLDYNGKALTPARQRAFGVWNDWADARVATGAEIWIIEAKIVGTGGAYGQVLDYCNEYPTSADYASMTAAPVIPIVLAAFDKPRTRLYYAQFGVRTVVFTPSWAGDTLASKVFTTVPSV